MAQKRMFDKAIVDTDNFMDLPISSKAIYFLLGMEADDEGFVSPRKVMKVHGGSNDDIKGLVDRGFVIPFKSGVVVITNWNENNYLDKNRIKPTKYQEERKQLVLTIDGKYELNSGSTSIEESRVVESSIEQDNIHFDEFWNSYPKKVEKKKSELKWNRLEKEIQEKIIKDIPLRKSGRKWKAGFVENPLTYLNGERWNDEIELVKIIEHIKI